ncbi:hypothetical protein JCGZ_19246 [Jatropha curcas]|uniref:F-box domain-containing protein n=1 Tax=Jatropha curcas TaxID=180498 RepID=A0A067K387_JATCU|nr:F-box/kelch-repeat protein SKIP20 [Jatropha curcas]KDP29533.1 hypothetical protein JCGZ_19246 [Jatropha curcas]
MAEEKNSIKNYMGVENQQLIPGLPDEIAMECLVKVPCQFHSNMKSVCHSWQNLISNPSFYQLRLKSGNSEQLICLVQPLPSLDSIQSLTTTIAIAKKEDKLEHQQQQQQQIHSPPQFGLNIYNATYNTWQKTEFPGKIPMFCQCLAIPSANKLLILGGWDSDTLEPVPDVYILDLAGASGCRWRRGAPMSVSRSFFACEVVGQSWVYVAGGHDRHKNALNSAEVYDIERNEWRILPNMIEDRDECHGMAFEGDNRFWVVSGYGTDSQGQFRSDAECYDPDNGVWHKITGVWPFSSTSPRGATTIVSSVNKNEHQWRWFLGGQEEEEEQQIHQNDEIRWELIRSNPVPDCGKNPFVMNIGYGDNKNRVFLVSGSSRRSESSFSCSECDFEGTFILDKDCNNGRTKWNHVHTPAEFSGFPFSACYLTI